MPNQITRTELDDVKGALKEADAGRPSLVALARAYEICLKAGAKKTLEALGDHIRRAVAKRELTFPRAVAAGLLSGTIVTLTVGRMRR